MSAPVLALSALARTRRRALVSYDGARRLALPERALWVEPTPHEWLLPRVAAVVHHGGAGTTGAVLRAGVPSVGIPGFFDQPFWCRRVAELGAGTKNDHSHRARAMQAIAPRLAAYFRLANRVSSG